MAKNWVFRVGCQPNLKIFRNSDLLMSPLIMVKRKAMEHFFRGQKPFRAQWGVNIVDEVWMENGQTMNRGWVEGK